MPQFQILPGFFSQGIEIPTYAATPAQAGSVAQDATKSQEGLVTHQLPGAIEQVPARFGLIDDSPDRWAKFRARLADLNSGRPGENELGTTEPEHVEGDAADHKFLLLVRHGEGYHNVAEAKYGTKAWDDYWSKLEGDGELLWGPDPLPTPLGVSQAKYTRTVWEEERRHGLGLPSKIYCSPHSRALKTCEIVFEGHHSLVEVIENCREENGVHTCDKRRTRSFIAKNYPAFAIEDSLTEEDELWDADVRETKAQVADRARLVLERIWNECSNDEFIAATAHSGFINGVLVALGSKPYPLPTGGALPLVIRRVP